jgi:hypothetical protein
MAEIAQTNLKWTWDLGPRLKRCSDLYVKEGLESYFFKWHTHLEEEEGERIIIYEHTSHPSNIKTKKLDSFPFGFVADFIATDLGNSNWRPSKVIPVSNERTRMHFTFYLLFFMLDEWEVHLYTMSLFSTSATQGLR